MTDRVLKSITILSLMLISCGSVHQFIPPQPLEPDEFRASLTYSYDINRMAVLGSFGGGFYWGAGKNLNLGLGFEPPIGISHLTAVRYFNPDKSTSRRMYASIYDLTPTLDIAPNFEIGGGITKKAGPFYHTIALGFWVSFREGFEFINNGTYRKPLWMAAGNISKFPIIGPAVKYDFSDKDYTISIVNNIGLTKTAIAAERWKLENRQRIVFENDKIEFLEFDFNTKRISIKTRDQERYLITPKHPNIDLISPDIDRMRLERFNPKDNWDYYFVGGNLGIRLYELDFGAIIGNYADKQDIVLGSFPARKREIFKMIKWYKHDWTIGIGLRATN